MDTKNDFHCLWFSFIVNGNANALQKIRSVLDNEQCDWDVAFPRSNLAITDRTVVTIAVIRASKKIHVNAKPTRPKPIATACRGPKRAAAPASAEAPASPKLN